MGKRGPKPEPTKLKLLKGNPGQRKLNPVEPKPIPIAPCCPDWLDDEARTVWQRNAPMLERLGLLTELDGDAFARYCQAQARVVQFERLVTDYMASHEGSITYDYTNKSGAENTILIPEVKAAQNAHAIAARLAAVFGMEPSSRGQMRLKGDGDPEDEMEKMLR